MLLKITIETTAKSTADKITSALSKGAKVVHLTACKDNCDQFYTDVASHIGEHAPMEEDIDGCKTGSIHTHIKYPWHTESKSYSHSNTRQPFHTDGSYESNAPQITYFFCKEEAKCGGSTIFIENQVLVDLIDFYDTEFLKELKSTQVEFSKGNDCKKKYIIDKDNKLTWNWHRCNQQLPLNIKFHEFLEKNVFETGTYESISLKAGEALFFMDEEVLHGRNCFIGPRWLVKGGIYYERSSNS